MKALSNLGNQDPIKLALGAVLVIGVLYYLGKRTITAVADTAASAVSGNNAITQNQTNASGDKTTAYEGKGIAGTVGAAFNSASGGTLASIGESVGGWLYDMTHLDSSP